MKRWIFDTLNPANYHGNGKRPPFFEGWYYKFVSADENQRYAIIPGVQLGEQGHAFVQVLDGVSGQSAYHEFPLNEFWASRDHFEIRIGANRFTSNSVSLDIDRPEGQIRGKVHFENVTSWPVSLLSPGIMGWYAWVPTMECYHGVLSFDHECRGELKINNTPVLFDGGRGYIEKDWGKSFPAAWVWFQTNHFQEPGVCITASVAIIPWGRITFPGFIVGLFHQGKLYRFATYTGARIEKLDVTDDHVTWVIRGNRHRLEMRATRAEGGLLLGPTRTDMSKRVNETLRAAVDIRLTALSGDLIYDGKGRHAGLEAHGDLAKLMHMLGK